MPRLKPVPRSVLIGIAALWLGLYRCRLVTGSTYTSKNRASLLAKDRIVHSSVPDEYRLSR
eukprot:2148650-Rhodomonas_salina.1